nr:unnamed protein product [Callosobruchus analis]
MDYVVEDWRIPLRQRTGRECNVVSGMPKTPMSNGRMLCHMLIQTIIYMSVPFATIYSIPYMRERSKNK